VDETEQRSISIVQSILEQTAYSAVYEKIQIMSSRLTRRRFLALSGATAAHGALFAASTPVAARSHGAKSLAGQWRFSLDRDDVGVSQLWFAKVVPGDAQIALPGILQTQGYGDEITAETKFVAALPRDMRWYLLPQYAAYTRPGHVEVPYLSQPTRHYLGVAWYQREITIPAAWRGKRIVLTLERTRWETSVYVDTTLVGSNRSLVAPHEFDLGVLQPGSHRLSIRIDNRMLQPPYRPDGHSVSDSEGSTWNGVVGKIELTATTPVWIEDAQVFPDVAAKSARVKVRIGNSTGKIGKGTLAAGQAATRVSWTAEGGEAVLIVPLPNAKPWSEFNPELQHVHLRLTGDQADDRRELTFGLREITVQGKHILLNGEVFNLRATHDGGGFPLTGYPATDVETWKRIIGICKEWGLNGIRFHSWCPSEAAFTAADEMGFYLQPECGMWNSFDAEGKMLAVLNDETARLLKAYGNHPSLILLNATNEPAGHYRVQLPLWDKKWHNADSRRLYSDGTGRPAVPPAGEPYAADYIVTSSPAINGKVGALRARGPSGWFGRDYETSLQQINCPVIGHEVGQWCAYPDFSVIEKFSGKQPHYAAFPDGIGSGKTPYMVPGNYRIWRDSARASGLLALNKAFAHASGRFQVACYKEEIEANLRTPSFSGYELLDLHDYLGQGGALVGLLDAFWESKGYITPSEFRRYNNTTVPLARLKERVYTTSQTLTVPIELAHFGPAPLSSTKTEWQIMNQHGEAVASGVLPERTFPRGKNLAIGTIRADLAKLPAPAMYKLEVRLQNTTFCNEWQFWLYPPVQETPAPQNLVVTGSWEEAETALRSGGKVLFLSGSPEQPSPDLALSTVPIFWNRLMNPRGAWMLGLWCDATHAALAGFPTESNCDWQWVDLLPGTTALNLDLLPRTLPSLVQPIDDWNRNLRLSMLFECFVGSGKLIVTSLDLSQKAAADTAHPGTAALRRSVLNYMASPNFQPVAALTLAQLQEWIPKRYMAPKTSLKPDNSPSPDLVDPGQIRRNPA
jgi:hypothetical protein